MPIFKRWSRINSWNLANVPDEPGVYEIADRWRNIVDIGGSENLAYRIPEKIRNPKFGGQARFFRYDIDYDPGHAEAEHQAVFMARRGQKPKFTFRVQGEAYDILDDILGWRWR